MSKKKVYKPIGKATEEEMRSIQRAAPLSAGIDTWESVAPETLQQIVETGSDVATVVPQAMSLELADEAVEKLFGKEAADKYRDYVSQARQRSPISTTLAELASPSPISKLKLATKVGKKIPQIAEDVATYAAIQKGTGQDITEGGVIGSMAAGAGLRALPKLFSDYQKSRAAHLNIGDISRFDKKAKSLSRQGKYVDVEDYTRQMLDRYDKEYNFFAPGKTTFDPVAMKFIPESEVTGGKLTKAIKRSAQAPSRKELLMRNRTASEQVADRLNKRLDELSEGDISMQMGMFETPDVITINREQFDNYKEQMFADLIAQNQPIDPKVRNEISEAINMVKDEVFGGKDLAGGGNLATIRDLNDAKRRIYDMVEGEYEKLNVSTPKKEALQRMAVALKTMVNDLAGDPEVIRMNKFLEDMNSSREGLLKGVAGQFAEKSTTGIKPYGTAEYKAGSFLEKQADRIMTPISQMSAEIQQDPALMEGLKGMSSAAMPRLFRAEESDLSRQSPIYRSPDAISAQMNLPTQLISMRIPRTVEGIMENKQLVLAKVAQEMPMMFPQIQAIMESAVDVNDALPMLIEMLPHMFEKDRYNRINNILPEDMKPMVMEEIRKDENLSPTEKISRLDLMNRTGEYYA